MIGMNTAGLKGADNLLDADGKLNGDNDDREHFMRIGELADELGVTLRTLRFYEDKGLVNPKRVGLTRLFSKSDRARLGLIMSARKFGFTLREIKQMLDMYRPGESNGRQVQFALEKSRRQLVKLERQFEETREAIDELKAWISDMEVRLEAAKPEA